MFNVQSIDDLDNFIIENQNDVVLLYFGTSWCGPCKLLKERLAQPDTINEMPYLKVCYIDTDENEEISELYKITTLPTQIFVRLYENKVKIAYRIEGYNYTKLLYEYNIYLILWLTNLL